MIYKVKQRTGRQIQGDIDKESYGKYKIGDLRKTFKKYQDKKDWKNPVYAIVDTEKEAEELREAVIFFQADVPKVEKITVPVKHKEGLVYMEGTAYLVKSKGYQG